MNGNAPTTNILKAILAISKVNDFSLPSLYGSSNRMNSVGDALECFAKDIFCDSVQKAGSEKESSYEKYLSYTGNAKNPPDFMIKNGDAVEVKKVTIRDRGLPLNSSYPKDKLHSDDPLLTAACRAAEKWTVKDMVYVVGVVANEKIKSLWFVDGGCYAADREVYDRIKKKMQAGVQTIEGVEFADTTELGRVNKIDPLGITYLRVRGMWGIQNPSVVFGDLELDYPANKVVVYAIVRSEKYNLFPKEDRNNLEENKKITIEDIRVKNPNNPVKKIDAKLIKMKL
jgi:hypothetical protein